MPRSWLTLLNGIPIPALGLSTKHVNSVSQIEVAIEAGYRLFDTHPEYGNEWMIGQAIRKSKLAREEFFV